MASERLQSFSGPSESTSASTSSSSLPRIPPMPTSHGAGDIDMPFDRHPSAPRHQSHDANPLQPSHISQSNSNAHTDTSLEVDGEGGFKRLSINGHAASRSSDTRQSRDTHNCPSHKRTQGLRKASATPSVTSNSEAEDEDGRDHVGVDEEARSWLDLGVDNASTTEEPGNPDRKGKGKSSEGKAKNSGNLITSRLPPEILLQIFQHLTKPGQLSSSLLVSRSWCVCAFSLIWYKPSISTLSGVAAILRVIQNQNRSLPYANAIRKLNLCQIGSVLSDEMFLPLSLCGKLERLNISGAIHLSAPVLTYVLSSMPGLTALDLTGVSAVDDSVLKKVGECCGGLEALNVTECWLVGDEGVMGLVGKVKGLRRVKFDKCHRITPLSLIPLIRSTPLLLELTFPDLPAVTSSVLHTIFLGEPLLRDLKVGGCSGIGEGAIPNLLDLDELSEDALSVYAKDMNLDINLKNTSLTILRPITTTFEHLRVLDFTLCTSLTDASIDNLVTNAPKIRQLTLAKCQNLTDKICYSIGRLGIYLHSLHLGHVVQLTDEGVIHLARSCTRLRFLDLACCVLLTDASVNEVGKNMPKLRRFGLVKVTNITDQSLYALVKTHSTLERIHLSYCDQLSVQAVAYMLNRLGNVRHLSLTGVTSFVVAELQAFGKAPPESFNDHQREAFCVYTGSGVDQLRNYLNKHYLPSIDDTSEDSAQDVDASSSSSSLTIPGAGGNDTSRPGFGGGQAEGQHEAGAGSGSGQRRSHTGHSRGASTSTVNPAAVISPGIPSGAFRNAGSASASIAGAFSIVTTPSTAFPQPFSSSSLSNSHSQSSPSSPSGSGAQAQALRSRLTRPESAYPGPPRSPHSNPSPNRTLPRTQIQAPLAGQFDQGFAVSQDSSRSSSALSQSDGRGTHPSFSRIGDGGVLGRDRDRERERERPNGPRAASHSTQHNPSSSPNQTRVQTRSSLSHISFPSSTSPSAAVAPYDTRAAHATNWSGGEIRQAAYGQSLGLGYGEDLGQGYGNASSGSGSASSGLERGGNRQMFDGNLSGQGETRDEGQSRRQRWFARLGGNR